MELRCRLLLLTCIVDIGLLESTLYPTAIGWHLLIDFLLSLAVVAIFILCYNKIFAVTFDEDFSKASGVRAERYNLLIAVITAVIIVLAMNLVGSLLISALIVFPALSAMRVFKSFLKVIICSAVISVICAAAGIVISILFSTPTGSTIVTADIVVFAVFWLVSLVKGKE